MTGPGFGADELMKMVAERAAVQAAAGPQKDTKTDQERIDAVLSTPLFMSSLTEYAEQNETLSALQSLTFDGTPEEVAENFKVQGNAAFVEGPRKYKDALTFYTRGLQAKANDDKLNSILYSNRAAVNLELQNYRQVLNDCAAAIKLNRSNIKAYFRSVKALLALDRIAEGVDCAERALEIDPRNTAIQGELKKLRERKAVLDELEAKRRQREQEQREKEQKLKDAIAQRGYKMVQRRIADDGDSDAESSAPPTRGSAHRALIEHPLASDHKITLDPITLRLKFPVLLLYPEHSQSDFIAEFDEADTFYAHFETMFGDPAPWDPEHHYNPQSLDLFFETHESVAPKNRVDLVPIFRSVKAANAPLKTAAHNFVYMTLGDVLKHHLFCVIDGVCTFVVVVRGSEFATTLRKQYRSA
ncbi:HSP70/90 co-chaperone [Polyrhizophydium stewartii]|uniref:HSP70/90 co-chaperone n=1 Tax=Polyrhizophydium stewartii TaxID=2732419 RepID=A0ABR4NAL0_9FUNG|nr:hypothetical protein HK105_006187 [Polyrhizophydium stewartii]